MPHPNEIEQALRATIGQVTTGEPFCLSNDDVDHFEKGTWLDKAYPDESVPEFPDTLIEGFHLLSMLDATARFALGDSVHEMWGLNYGLDKVRFVSQVHRGDRIIPSFETVEVVPKHPGYKLLRRCTFTVEGHSTPAMVADWWVFALERGTFLDQ